MAYYKIQATDGPSFYKYVSTKNSKDDTSQDRHSHGTLRAKGMRECRETPGAEIGKAGCRKNWKLEPQTMSDATGGVLNGVWQGVKAEVKSSDFDVIRECDNLVVIEQIICTGLG